MDIKTLEYMEKRTNRGRKIVNLVNQLERDKEELEVSHIRNISFSCNQARRHFDQPRLIDAIVTKAIEAIEEEVSLLQKEFDEL